MSFLIPDIQEIYIYIYIYIYLKYTAIYIKFIFLKCSKYIAYSACLCNVLERTATVAHCYRSFITLQSMIFPVVKFTRTKISIRLESLGCSFAPSIWPKLNSLNYLHVKKILATRPKRLSRNILQVLTVYHSLIKFS